MMTQENSMNNAELDAKRKAFCDQIVTRAAVMMLDEVGASMGMMLDRMLTYVGAQTCAHVGSAKAAEVFRDLAAKIDAGFYHSVTGEDKKPGERH